MALVAYLDWEVRTTGHDLNCSGFNPNRDPTNGVDYTQQDNAEIISLNWTVDTTNNTWIRSTELTNWVNSGKVLASLKGNHIHIAGKAIGGNTLFQWVASTAVPGAYYLQALGGGNPNWPTKPTRFWMNKVFVLENTSLPSGSNSWTYGDKDSLGYSTIYVRFGAESDADPNIKAQDDIIADGQTWTRGAYEIVNVGTDGNGPYLVLDRSPGAAGGVGGYGRIGGAMASPGGVGSIAPSPICFIYLRPGTYNLSNVSVSNIPGSLPSLHSASNHLIRGCDFDSRYGIPASYPIINLNSSNITQFYCTFLYCTIVDTASSVSWLYRNFWFYFCDVIGLKCAPSITAIGTRFTQCQRIWGVFQYCYIDNSTTMGSGQISTCARYTVFKNVDTCGWTADGDWINCVIYVSNSHGITTAVYSNVKGAAIIDSCVVIGANGYAFHFQSVDADRLRRLRRCYYNACTLGGTNSQIGGIDEVTQLPGNPFRDPDNGDFRLADNEAGRMLKQAGFQIPGPQGAPPMKFDVGAVQNSFYDIQGSGGAVLPIPMMFGT